MLNKLRCAALVVAIAAASSVQASGEDAVVVTATRTPERASALTSDISVITREQIERAPQSSLAELLQAQPGLQVSTNGGIGTPTSVSIRGGSSQQTLVLIDGERLSSSTVGTTALENIPLNQIERIEILRGPASSLYGADAVAGVIQIFTRKGEGAPHLTIEAGAGSYRTAVGSLDYGGRIGGTRFNVNLGYTGSGSFSATKPGTYGYNPDRDPYLDRNLSAQVSHRFGADHELGARLFYSRGTTHFDAANCDPTYTVCTNNFDNYQKQTLSSTSIYTRDRLAPNWTSELRLGRSEDNMTGYYLDPVADSVGGQGFRTTQNQYIWQNDIALASGKLMLAAERRVEMVNSNAVAYTVGERSTNALVGGYQLWLGAHTLQLSARRDDNSQFGSHSTGSLGYGYQFNPAWRATASVGTAFRAPTFNDLYWPVDFSSYYVGNPNLRPERARNRDVGLVYETAAQRFSLTAYENRVSDLITFGNAPTPAFFVTTVNVGTAVLKGATASYDGRFGSWKLRASYDVLSAKDADTGNYLIRRAKDSGSVELRYGSGRWDSGAQLVASGPRWVDAANTQQTGGFGLVNLDTRYALDRAWSMIARVNNLFDKKYELVQGFNTPGASLFVGVRYSAK
jgi:vitamin B12 transporter